MSTGSVVAWVVFLVAAPLVLWWLYRSNRRRGTDLQQWALERGWSYAASADDLAGLLGAEAFVPRDLGGSAPQEPRYRSDAHVLRGSRGGRAVLSWEHVHSSGAVGQRRPGPVHVVAVRAASAAGATQLTPRHAGIRLMAGPSHLPDVATTPDVDAAWVVAGDPAPALAAKRVLATGSPRPDLAAVRAESGLLAAWFVGRSDPDRIEPVLDWLLQVADEMESTGGSLR